MSKGKVFTLLIDFIPIKNGYQTIKKIRVENRRKRYIKQETSSLHSANVPISIGISFFKVKRLYSG